MKEIHPGSFVVIVLLLVVSFYIGISLLSEADIVANTPYLYTIE